MPFNKVKLAAMTTTSEEYISKEEIAERFDVTKRTVERLVEVFAKKLKKSKQRQGRKILYLWADILQCAKTHIGIVKEDIPSVAIERAYTKQRVIELEAEVRRLREENIRLLKTDLPFGKE